MLNRLFLTVLILLSACSKHERIFKRVSFPFAISQKNIEKKPVPNITIWVHGTCLWPFTIFRKYWTTDPSLFKVSSMKRDYYLRKVADRLCHISNEYSINDFYFLRWSGKLSVSEREDTALHLYKSIKNLLEKYKEEYGVMPNLTVVTHSHGGNVALNLSKIIDKDPNIKINKLILLACPVQKHTKDCIKDPMFENVYSFYSTLDFLQVLDPQGLHYCTSSKNEKKDSLFSGRNFPQNPKLCNVKMKINGKGIWHTQFLSKEFITVLPQVINKLDKWKKTENT